VPSMNRIIKESYILRIYPLTPVFIYSGYSVDGYETFIDGKNRLFVYNVFDFISRLNKERLEEIDTEFRRGKDPMSVLRQSINKYDDCAEAFKKSYYAWMDVFGDLPLRSEIEFKLFVRGGIKYKPYIPGSTLKGAILLEDKEIRVPPKDIKDIRKTERYNFSVSDTLEPDLTRGIKTFAAKIERVRIKDASPVSKGLKMFAEIWYSSDPLENYSVHRVDFRNLYEGGKFGSINSLESLFSQVNKYYLEVTENLKKIAPEEMLQFIKERLNLLVKKEKNYFILRVGQGIGRYTINIDKINIDKKAPKTMWSVLIEGKRVPLGWLFCGYERCSE